MSERPTSDGPRSDRPLATRSGPGRVLIAVYGLFALAATARAVVQIATKYDHAPLPYLLSAFAGVVYILATVGLAVDRPRFRLIAIVSCTVELVGVLGIGTASVLDSAAFPADTVWSWYGRGYGFVPLILPILGLLWLRYTHRARASDT